MPKQRHDFTTGFGHTAGPAFAQASHDAMMQTLRDLASEPERKSQIEARDQATSASRMEQANSLHAQPYKLIELSARASAEQSLAEYRKRLAELKSTKDLLKENADIFNKASLAALKNPTFEYMKPEDQLTLINQYYDVFNAAQSQKGKGTRLPTPVDQNKKSIKKTAVENKVTPQAIYDQFGF